MHMQLSSKIKGIVNISSANIISLALSMMTSFILPLFISVEQYGYWQLFILYTGYVGFFVLGFNDGIQLNYATYTYNKETAAIFRSFKKFIFLMTSIESVLLLFVAFYIYQSKVADLKVALMVIMNIIPTALIGMFIYMNQSTLRFKEYAWCNIFDKIIFAILMALLLCLQSQSAFPYICAYTLSRYSVIIYCYYSSKDVFCAKKIPLRLLRKDIICNFRNGFPLMIAVILGGPTIIVASRFLIEAKYGIDTFSSYSFALHTLIIAGQFIASVSTVFYPILKRCPRESLGEMYLSFDKISTLAGFILLISYFPAAYIVNTFYIKYSTILSYLYILYPLFIYQCKVNVLVTNMYKVKNQPIKLICVNGLGITINIIAIYAAYSLFNSVFAIALATVIGYMLWYYLLQVRTYFLEGWTLRPFIFADLFITVIFCFINWVISTENQDVNTSILYSCTLYTLLCMLICILFFKQLKSIWYQFKVLMKD